LIGDADGSDVFGVGVRCKHGLSNDFARTLPDFQSVVLDPARARHDLRVLLLCGCTRTVAVEENAACAGGALVDGGDEMRHEGVLQRRKRKLAMLM
jgi:hypothetical protein